MVRALLHQHPRLPLSLSLFHIIIDWKPCIACLASPPQPSHPLHPLGRLRIFVPCWTIGLCCCLPFVMVLILRLTSGHPVDLAGERPVQRTQRLGGGRQGHPASWVCCLTHCSANTTVCVCEARRERERESQREREREREIEREGERVPPTQTASSSSSSSSSSSPGPQICEIHRGEVVISWPRVPSAQFLSAVHTRMSSLQEAVCRSAD